MRPKFDPTKLVNDWFLPGLTEADRKNIMGELLLADADFQRLDFEGGGYAYIKPMQCAYAGIASILFERNLLTNDLIENGVRLFVIEAAVAGNWVLFPDTALDKGSKENFVKHRIFSADIAEWQGKLLKREANREPSPSPLRSGRFKPLDEAYQTIEFDGRQYDLTHTQSIAIRVLHGASMAKRASVGIKEIYKAIGTSSGKMSNWFRGKNKELYGTLIVKAAPSKSHYRLDL